MAALRAVLKPNGYGIPVKLRILPPDVRSENEPFRPNSHFHEINEINLYVQEWISTFVIKIGRQTHLCKAEELMITLHCICVFGSIAQSMSNLHLNLGFMMIKHCYSPTVLLFQGQTERLLSMAWKSECPDI